MKLTVKAKMATTIKRGKADSELPYGAYSKIARRVRPQVSANHVREVVLGRRHSPRIQRAIDRFRRELDAQAVA